MRWHLYCADLQQGYGQRQPVVAHALKSFTMVARGTRPLDRPTIPDLFFPLALLSPLSVLFPLT